MKNDRSIWGLIRKIKRRWLSGHSWNILLLGSLLVGGLWLYVHYQIKQDYDRTLAETSQETMNIARAFEEHVRRIVADADKDLFGLKLCGPQSGSHLQ